MLGRLLLHGVMDTFELTNCRRTAESRAASRRPIFKSCKKCNPTVIDLCEDDDEEPGVLEGLGSKDRMNPNNAAEESNLVGVEEQNGNKQVLDESGMMTPKASTPQQTT